MDNFNYGEAADLFTRKHPAPRAAPGGASPTEASRALARSVRRNGVSYRRFATGAEAIRFAIEELPAEGLAASVLEIDGERFECGAIRSLYESAQYPLPRRAPITRCAK